MSSPFSITSITSISAVGSLEPVKEFYLFKQIGGFRAREYWWGLEPGEIDIDSHLNRVSVCGDIERLLSGRALALIPTKEVIDTMLELTLYNQKHSVFERRRCFEYRLVPGSQLKNIIPPFAFDSSSGTFQRFDYPYDHLPLFTLDCYPFHSVMHSDFAIPRSPPIHENFCGVFKLPSRWASEYPHVGSFVTSPRVAAIIAADAAADNGDDPYSDLASTSSEEDDMLSDSDVSVSIEGPKNTRPVSVSLSKQAAKHIASWRENLEPVVPIVVSDFEDGSIQVSESRMPFVMKIIPQIYQPAQPVNELLPEDIGEDGCDNEETVEGPAAMPYGLIMPIWLETGEP
ncbi:hypothetical protein BT96DRAFT_1006638 [Gymnopus androsaceus JB14]|uniref:Uncharacterized protein n=1 Tax=Gymnopus androsaceus JB14 TaxID=1447944 RepID=A0A6A4GKP9_9AGAR|nr:hypothetical protein BT96DRAFT_1006638 [Gymnopus androsaceus JB14]